MIDSLFMLNLLTDTIACGRFYSNEVFSTGIRRLFFCR